jgi:predicted Holliday junction resolvase-like endonuclease
MTALDVILILAVLVLAVLLFVTLRARRHDRRVIESRESAMSDHRQRVTEATAAAERSQAEMHHVRAARERVEAELHEARLQIVGLEQRRDLLEAAAGEEAGSRSLFIRSSSENHPEDSERERSRLSRGG